MEEVRAVNAADEKGETYVEDRKSDRDICISDSLQSAGY